MSGTEFLNLTAAQYPDLIRLILTNNTDEDLVEASKAGNVFKYVNKPCKLEELKALVRQALDTHNKPARTQVLCRTLQPAIAAQYHYQYDS